MISSLETNIAQLADQIDTGDLDIIDSEFKMRAGRHGIQKALEKGEITSDEASNLHRRLNLRTPRL